MLDTVAKIVRGAVHAKDCRVVWKDGFIYIAKTPTDIVRLECEEPQRRGTTFSTIVGVEFLTFIYPGCGSCRERIRKSGIL